MRSKNLAVLVLIVALLVAVNDRCLAINLSKFYTTENPYYNAGLGNQCTAFAWGRAYEKTGIKLRFKGGTFPSANRWPDDCLVEELNLSKGRQIQPDSIAVWAGDAFNPNGHVAYIERVEPVNEGGRTRFRAYFNEANVETYKRGGAYDGYEKNCFVSELQSRGRGFGPLVGYLYLNPLKIKANPPTVISPNTTPGSTPSILLPRTPAPSPQSKLPQTNSPSTYGYGETFPASNAGYGQTTAGSAGASITQNVVNPGDNPCQGRGTNLPPYYTDIDRFNPFAQRYTGQCTWYVYGRIQELGLATHEYLSKAKNGRPVFVGSNAYDWDNNADAAGFRVEYGNNAVPTPGSIVGWDYTSENSGKRVYHIAVAESASGTPLRITESNKKPSMWHETVIMTEDSVRLRKEPRLNSEVLWEMPKLTLMENMGGPRTADGYEWWQLAGNGCSGWAALIERGEYEWNYTRIALSPSTPMLSRPPSWCIYLTPVSGQGTNQGTQANALTSQSPASSPSSAVPVPTSPQPVIAAVSPNPVTGSNSQQPFTIYGSVFSSDASVKLRDLNTGETFKGRLARPFTGTQIALSTNFTTDAHNWSVEVINPDGRSSGQYYFNVVAPPSYTPMISSVSPNPVPGSNSQQPFMIYGSNFMNGANIILRDRSTGETFANRPTSSVANTQIVLNPNFTTAAHNWSVEVVNPDGKSSGQYYFTVVAPASYPPAPNVASPNPAVPSSRSPVINSVSPNPVRGSDSKQPFTIYGSDFLSGANVILQDVTAGETFGNRPVSSFSSTQITLNPNFTTAAHTWSIEVINPDGRSTGEFYFAVR